MTIHHYGAMVPFFAQRVTECYSASGTIHGMGNRNKLRRPLIEYFKMFYTDTALSGGTAGLMCGYALFGPGRLLFGTDMPYDSEFGRRIVRLIIQSIERMTISDSEKKMIYEDNGRKLLNLQSPCSPLLYLNWFFGRFLALPPGQQTGLHHVFFLCVDFDARL